MVSIRRQLTVMFFGCANLTAILIYYFVNVTICSQIDEYMMENQEKRNERLVTYFEDYYQKNKQFSSDAGSELMHEAYMNQFCLILMDSNQNVIWGMSPDSIKGDSMAPISGDYQAKIYELKVDDELIGYLEIGQHTPLLLSQQDLDFKESINRSMILSTLVAIVIILGLSILFSKPLSKAIHDVSNMAFKISKGVFDLRIQRKSKIREIQILNNSINELADKLQQQDTLRKQLISDVSHELRTPLNILQTNFEAMIDGVLPLNQERLQSLNSEVIRFGELLKNLEVLKRFDSGDEKSMYAPLSLFELINGMESEIKALLSQKYIQYEFNSSLLETDLIIGNSNQIKQVILNLVSNSFKFTKEYGVVLIKLSKTSDEIILHVEDNGIGIKEDEIPYLFERFYRSDQIRHQTECSGIGLSIVKKIIDLHDAKVEIKSEVGAGTIVEIHFLKVI